MKQLCATILIGLFLLTACNQKNNEPKNSVQRTVLRFEVDSAGNISGSSEVKKQLQEIAVKANTHADRFTLYSYTEQLGSAEQNNAVAQAQADAAKNFMMQFGERVYYNVGVELKGFAEPVNAANPADKTNRRIEIEQM